MKYPKFLKTGDTIGITALSSGAGDCLKETKISLNHFKKDYHLVVTPNVYNPGYVSSDIKTRKEEFANLLKEDIKLLLNIRGGDFLYEVLDYLDLKELAKKNIWTMGYSDITSLLYLLTTKYDLATIYGFNAKSFDTEELEPYQLNNLKILQGNLFKQESFHDRETQSLNGDFAASGILIGGCLDVLRFLPGTNNDYTLKFIEKYKKYKIIWYFDIFCMDSVDVYLTLLQLKKIGWFKYTDTILVGSVLFSKEECDLSYKEAFKKVFSNLNIIYDANIGHVKPVFTIINGSLGKVTYQKDTMTLEMELLNENNG